MMKTMIFLSALMLLSGQVRAEGSKLSLLKTWFQNLKEGLSESAVAGQRQKTRVTAVAAVRGSEQEAASPDKVKWKEGRKSRKSREQKKEKEEFAQAVDMILAGQYKEGAERLEAFEKEHPQSQLLAEVRQAKEKALELDQAAQAPAVAAPQP
ncbi:MAG: hypothetical protein HY549_04965 [Elusimicrobia bacterium]|nr:hypothetical protein [Elusimicrobiota bacterium]